MAADPRMHRRTLVAALAGLVMASLPLPGGAATDRFTQAVRQYRVGRIADAYGRFVELANDGHAQAARIALFMYRNGPLLYGHSWGATPDEIAFWQSLGSGDDVRARSAPQLLDMSTFREGRRPQH